ncbi:MAG: amidohydrolase family protein [Chloroflexi bacterium]|nr:amidohydrolase family protein [Chloroflexota bacterium]
MPVETVLSAPLVFPIAGPPIEDGYVLIKGDRIAAVGRIQDLAAEKAPDHPSGRDSSRSRYHFPGSALLPGFVNAHAHLELSAMAGQIPRPADGGESFTQWIRRLLAIRETWGPAELDASTRAGVRQLIETGTTTVGDITSSGLSLDALVDSGLRAVAFREVLGFGSDREAAAAAACREWLDGAPTVRERSLGRVRPGLSPHAPHSTSPGIYRECARLARETGCLLATHLSETPEELEMIRGGGGPFWRLLEARQHTLEGWQPPGVSPVRYLHDLGILDVPGVAIHVNYPEPGDLALLRRGSLTPVYCPQSHQFFGHSPHPAAEMLRLGLPLALGTDSLASNDNLDMLEELRLVRRLYPEVSAERWLEAATLRGARALRMEAEVGSLEAGKYADLAVVRLPESPGAGDPADRILAPGSEVVGTMVGGRWLRVPAEDTASAARREQ